MNSKSNRLHGESLEPRLLLSATRIDIAPGGANGAWSMLAEMEDQMLLVSHPTTPGIGQEVYVSDGTTAGTSLLLDIESGSAGSDPVFVMQTADRVFFTAFQNGERAFWSTDGTTEGTILITDQSAPGPKFTSDISANDGVWAVVGDHVYWVQEAGGGQFGNLWVSDGTPEGTHVVDGIIPESAGSRRASIYEVASGAVIISSWTPEPDVRTFQYSFINESGEITELVTESVDTPVNELELGFPVSTADGLTHFTIYHYTMSGNGAIASNQEFEVWTTDGTVEGTSVRAMLPGQTGPSQHAVPFGHTNFHLFPVGNDLYFNLVLFESGGDGGVHVLRGGETEAVRLNSKFITGEFAAVNGKAFFARENQLWVSDGTPEGTSIVREFANGNGVGSDRPEEFTVANGQLYFKAMQLNTSGGFQVWVTDGTEAGTRWLGEGLGGTTDDDPIGLAANREGVVYFPFKTQDSGFNADFELWKSNGSALSTRQVEDVRQGVAGSNARVVGFFQNRALFAAFDDGQGVEFYLEDPPANEGCLLYTSPSPRD